MVKIAELLHAGCNVKILLADIHAYLDNMKAPLELVEKRTVYYEYIIKSLLRAVGVDIAKLEFIKGSSYQLHSDYTMDRCTSRRRFPFLPSKCSAQVEKIVSGARLGNITIADSGPTDKLEGITRISVAQKAGAEVVKQTGDPYLGGLIYPLMQALDEQYLDVDAQVWHDLMRWRGSGTHR